MPDRSSSRFSVSLAAALFVFLATVAVLVARPPSTWFETDLLSLLAAKTPGLSAEAAAALRHTVSEDNRRNTVVLLGVEESDLSPEVARFVREAVEDAKTALTAKEAPVGKSEAEEAPLFAPLPAPVVHATDTLREKAPMLVTAERAAWLESLPRDENGALTEEGKSRVAMRLEASLTTPVAPHWLGLDRDPLGFSDETLLAALARLPVREEAGLLRLTSEKSCGTCYLLLLLADAASAEAGEGRLTARIEAVRQAFGETLAQARLTPRFHATGVPLFTDAIARNAQAEMNRIALFSTVLVFGIAWLLFGSLVTVTGAVLAVAFGFSAGFAAALAIFGTLHLLTFVFGLTLIGVAVDYAVHWFCAGTRAPYEELLSRRRRLLPSLIPAAASSAAGYALLAATPMTGLQEIAVLAGVGLPATLLFVTAVLPHCPVFLPRRESRAMTELLRGLARLPRLADAPRLVRLGVVVLVAAFLAAGLSQVRFSGGAADLQNAPQALIADRVAIEKHLALPSPAQFYVVTGETLDEILRRQAILRERLALLRPSVRPTALVDFVPDATTQRSRAALSVEAQEAVSPVLEALLGAAPTVPSPDQLSPVTPEDWAEAGLGTRIESLLPIETGKEGSRLLAAPVFLQGVSADDLGLLAGLADRNTQFVNLTAAMEGAMAEHRGQILFLLTFGVSVLTLCLSLRLGRDTWRAVVPPVLGIACALALLGLLQVPVTLFTALALILLLGLGVDYGIFLCHQPDHPRAFAAVLLSGITSLASFGLLALSSTPALFGFGATVGVGLSVILVTAPLLRRRPPASEPVGPEEPDGLTPPAPAQPISLPAQGGLSC